MAGCCGGNALYIRSGSRKGGTFHTQLAFSSPSLLSAGYVHEMVTSISRMGLNPFWKTPHGHSKVWPR